MKHLDTKYSYDIDERGIHLFRYGENSDNFINNPLLHAINKIENLEKENEQSKKENIFLRGRAKQIIIEFMKWYLSGSDYQDDNCKIEAEKYADDFLSAFFETTQKNTVDDVINECYKENR